MCDWFQNSTRLAASKKVQFVSRTNQAFWYQPSSSLQYGNNFNINASYNSLINNNKDVVGSRWTKEQGASPEAKEQEESPSQGTERGMKLIGPMCHSTTAGNAKQALNDGGLSYSYSYSSEQLGTKVEMVYNLLSMLGTHDRAEMTSTLLAMSSSPDSCKAMRQSGCLSLLVQLVHSSGESAVVRQRAAQALRNMVHCHGDDKRGRREARVLRLLDQVSSYCDTLSAGGNDSHVEDAHPGPAIAALMKLSFDEEHRLAMCQLGAIYVVARLVQVEAPYQAECCITLKRYAGMALTNLTFGDGNNKALLCSMKPFMSALVAQLGSTSEDLVQVTASVLRNLSWRADAASKQSLREVGSVPALVKASMTAKREPTMKSVLSALWNLSAHCNINKVDICGVEGALQYLVQMLNYQSTSKTLAVVENAGGILRNISSHIAVREDYRKIIRDQNCLAILLRQLQSASLTVVSNACGTLWNLSARCATDQRALVALGAVPMLTSLAHSRHRMIAMGASAALKNLLPIRLAQQQASTPSGSASLLVRKRRALEAELSTSLSETCDNIDSCPQWDSDKESTSSQAKDDCDQINQSVQQITLEETMSEEPVNYSLKYCDENKGNETDNDAVNYSIKFKEPEGSEEKRFGAACFKEETDSQNDYAETDLDQLTDYSLRYSEEEHNDSADGSSNVNDSKEDEPKPQAEPNSSSDTPTEKREQTKATVLETPLMFSRCSSLGSLSSCEQQDDCRSSGVSEFSRMTSGILSPSDIPDSPSQTIPPSPRVRSRPSLPVTVEEKESSDLPGVFDDSVKAFKEESTPAQFSTASTSLSDLTIEDDNQEPSAEKLLAAVSEEEDENILADCINSGMQNNRESNISRIPRARGIPVKAPTNIRHPNPALDETPVQFCTEDTPASLSHATSHSELSCALSDASSDHENILAECIQSGMPQPQVGGMEKKTSTVQTAQVVPSLKTTSVKPRPVSVPTARMRQILAEDEIKVFASEESPGDFSIGSSLSDLTINSKPEKAVAAPTPPVDKSSPPSSLDPEVPTGDDVALGEQEDQDLLMQVISSGLPTAHSGSSNSAKVADSLPKDTDTWADDTSSYPSVSVTIPAVESYNSDDDEKTERDEATLVGDTGVIKLGSGKVALISHLDMEESYQNLENVQPPSNMASMISLYGSGTGSMNEKELAKNDFELHGSMQSLQELEMVQPPSGMNSIISLTCSLETDRKHRVLTRADSLLENVKPPTEMDEIPDLDNSILSVASICSEVADSLEDLTLEATPPSQRKAAAKKRELGKFRYNTYVVNKNADKKPTTAPIQPCQPSLDTSKSTESLDEAGPPSPKTKINPKQRRLADRERFRTRTIHDGPPPVDRLSSVESECQSSEGAVSPVGPASESTSEADDPPRPIVTKPPEVKSIRTGSARGSAIPVVRSPVKTIPPTGKKKPVGTAAPLQRQGTFTKDDSASSSIPVPIKSKIASPIRKNPLVATKSAGNCSGGGRGRAASLPNKSSGMGVRTSLSNQSLKSACSDGGNGHSNGGSNGTRWHSNSSLNSSPSGGGREPKKDATSKIASLWKKVDENKKKQPSMDTRVWIPPEPKSKQIA
ncbi:medulla oblongata development [Nesidiocoris tenuis]|uniref:Medulla oblongata development n=1 Tax=Nesidiocoris tenuis TaxID=355587 RepID=A0ABN7ASR8_9HEMI|nr:medulla oblongata development [Nesidiocoris tenuis]